MKKVGLLDSNGGRLQSCGAHGVITQFTHDWRLHVHQSTKFTLGMVWARFEEQGAEPAIAS